MAPSGGDLGATLGQSTSLLAIRAAAHRRRGEPEGFPRGSARQGPNQVTTRATYPQHISRANSFIMGPSSWKHLNGSFGSRGRSLGCLLEAVPEALGARFGACWGPFRGLLEASRWPLGGLLGASWGLLGASRGPLGASWGLLGAEGTKSAFGSPVWASSQSRLGALMGRLRGVVGRLGILLGRLGAVLGGSWAVLGRSWRPLGLSWSVGKLKRREPRKLSKTRKKETTIFGSWGLLEKPPGGVLEASWAVLGLSWAS